jgi:hypothetical protein
MNETNLPATGKQSRKAKWDEPAQWETIPLRVEALRRQRPVKRSGF